MTTAPQDHDGLAGLVYSRYFRPLYGTFSLCSTLHFLTMAPQNQAFCGSIWQYLTRRQKENPTKYRIFFDISWSFSDAREGTRTPKDKPHAPQTCASASSATLAYSVRAALRTSEVGSRLCGLLEYSTTFAGNRQAFFGFFIDFFGVHILIEPTKIQKQRAREVLACVCLYHVCGECF